MAKQTRAVSKQSLGGTARAQKLSRARKSEIGRKGAAARWSGEYPVSQYDGVLRVGDIEFDCAVLEDETRVISETKFMEAMGMYRSGALSTRRENAEDGARTPLHLAHKNLKPFVEKHLSGVHAEPVRYRAKNGSIGHGIRAEVLPKICEVWLDARKAGVLGSRQEMIADKADILIRGFAHIGVVALIDEATGFQYARQRDALEKLLEEYLSEELRRWVKTFPAEYFRELCRLREVQYRPDMRLPQYFGHLTNDIIYKRLHPRVLAQLQERTGRNDSGNRPNKLHQYLSDDVGHPKLLQHLGTVIGYMRLAKNYDEFREMLERGAPIPGDRPLFDQFED